MKLENSFTVPVSVEETWRVLLDVERIAPCVPGATLTSHEGDSFGGKVKVKLGPIGLTYGGTATFLSRDETAKVAVIEASGRETRGAGTAKAVVTCRLVDADGSTEVLVETDLAITGKPAQFGRGTLADVAGTLIGQFAANLADEITGGSASPDEVGTDTAGTDTAGTDTAGTDTAGTATENDAAPAVAVPAVSITSGGANGAAPDARIATVPAAAPDAPVPAALSRPAPAAGSKPAARPAAEPIDLLGAAGGSVLKRVGPGAVGTVLLILLLIIWRRRA